MLKILRSGRVLLNDINNFLKTEAEIINDFKVRINNTLREIDKFQSGTDYSYNQIVTKVSEVESIFFTSASSLHIEENY